MEAIHFIAILIIIFNYFQKAENSANKIGLSLYFLIIHNFEYQN
jgi:hypothetical protein